MRTDGAHNAGEPWDGRDGRADDWDSGPRSTPDADAEDWEEEDGREEDEDSCPIVQISLVDPAGASAPMSTEEQCQMLMGLARNDPDSHIDLFRNALSRIIDAVDRRMLYGRHISRDRMALYTAEFDTWHSYMIRVLKSCRGNWMQRAQSVTRLAGHCISAEWDYAVKRLMETLVDLYKDDAWNEAVSNYLEFGIPEEYEDDPFAFITGEPRHAQIPAPDRINLYLTILERAGSDPGWVLKEHWMIDDRICTRYLQYLLLHGRSTEAGRAATVGLELFPRSVRLAAAALKGLDPADEGSLMARCVLYAADPGSEHYEAAKASVHWDKRWARRLAVMLAACGEHGQEILVLTEAGMHAEALDALRYDGTLRMAMSHRKTFAASDPDGYYEACRALVRGAPKMGAGKEQHVVILRCLYIMKAIPGHESDFEEICESMISDECAVPAALRKLIRKVVEPQ